MKRRNILSVLLCLCFLFCLTACSSRTDVGEEDFYIYCLNVDRTGLMKVRLDMDTEDTGKAVELILNELHNTPEELDYTAPIPEHVKIEGYDLRGSILDISFNSAYLDIETVEEKLVRAAVVQSLVQLRGVNAVSFTVGGIPFEDSSGQLVGLMSGDDFVENTSSSPSSYQTATLTLYFANETGDKLVPQKRDVKYSSNVSREKLIVQKLVMGPKKGVGYPLINPDTNLLGVTIKDDICYVNLDSTFLISSYDVLPEITVYSIVNSIVEGTDATMVQIAINGETKTKYMEAVDLSKPLEANMDWVAAEDEE